MQTEIEKSGAALSVLDTQSQMMSDTQREYNAYGDTVNQSRSILQRLGRREMFDYWMIMFSVVLFLCAVVYILQRRLWIPSVVISPISWVIKLLDY